MRGFNEVRQVKECVNDKTVREYDLTKQTMWVHNNFKPDATIHFMLTADEVVQLSRTQLGHGLELGFEVVGGLVAERRMPPFSVVIGDVVADFQPGFG